MSYLGGWASNSGILISIYPPPQHPPPLFLSSAPPFSYSPSQLPLFCFFSPLPPFLPCQLSSTVLLVHDTCKRAVFF